MQPFAGRDVDQWRSEEARAKGGGDTASPGSHVVCCAWLNSSWDTIGGNAFGALTAVSGSLRPQTLAPLRRSGVGRERKPPETCAWEPKPRCRRGSGTPLRAVQPERQGQAPLPHHPAIKGEPRGCFAKAQPSGVHPRACGLFPLVLVRTVRNGNVVPPGPSSSPRGAGRLCWQWEQSRFGSGETSVVGRAEQIGSLRYSWCGG